MARGGPPVEYEFDPFEIAKRDKPKNRSIQKEIRQEVADFVLEEVLSYVGEGRSPVASGRWKRGLSKEYKAFKAGESGVSYANMELSGDMLDALKSKLVTGGKIRLGIKGTQAGKADGHNHFHSDNKNLPKREFIPKEGRALRVDIVRGIKEIIDSHTDEG